VSENRKNKQISRLRVGFVFVAVRLSPIRRKTSKLARNEQAYSHAFAFLDVETTGLSPWFGGRICEIGIVRCDGEKTVETFDSLLNPEKPITPVAARVNGLKDADLIDAPKFADIAEQVVMLVRGAVIVCHNIPFDLGFLSSELERIKLIT